jgi:hypothetical protein
MVMYGATEILRRRKALGSESLDTVFPTQKIVHDEDFCEYVQQEIRSAELLSEISLLQTDLSNNDISDQYLSEKSFLMHISAIFINYIF